MSTKPTLSSLPARLPTWAQTVADLGDPHPTNLGRALGVDVRTVRRWHASQDAPRPVLLSLYWLTQWGQSQLDADQFNRAQTLQGLADAQALELALMRSQVAAYHAISHARRLPSDQAALRRFPESAPRITRHG